MSRIPFTPSQRFEILTRDSFTCQYCGGRAPNVQLVVDHVVPVAAGGSNNPDNLVAACFSCNAGKAASSLPEGMPTAFRLKRIADSLQKIDNRLQLERGEATERVIRVLTSLSLVDVALSDTLADYDHSTWETWMVAMLHRIKFKTAVAAARALSSLTETPPPEWLMSRGPEGEVN